MLFVVAELFTKGIIEPALHLHDEIQHCHSDEEKMNACFVVNII